MPSSERRAAAATGRRRPLSELSKVKQDARILDLITFGSVEHDEGSLARLIAAVFMSCFNVKIFVHAVNIRSRSAEIKTHKI